jgi:transposase
MIKNASSIKVEIMAHHGLVAAIGKKLKIEDKVNARLIVQDREENISRGQSVMAMVINGLGFVERRLYMVEKFFTNKPVEHLLGKGVTSKHLNDDNLGRTLDAIHEYGVSKFFSEIAFEIGVENNAIGKTANLDTTSLAVDGRYNVSSNEGEECNEFVITHGHSKDHRPDLKQLVLSLTTTGPASIPIWLEALSGNSSDKSSFVKTIESAQKFQEELKAVEPFIWVADSALYTKDKLLSKGNSVLWVTRVPETLSESKQLTQKDKNEMAWIELPKGYSISPVESNYGGVKQRWFLVHSEEAYLNDVKAVKIMIEKKEKSLKDAIGKVEKEQFYCEKDAIKDFKKFAKKHSLFILGFEVISVYGKKNGKKGRPTEEEKIIKGYCLKISYKKNELEIKKHENARGRFVLATNDFNLEELPDEKILMEYKNQSKTEKAFRFLKDSSFYASEIYLKKPERIEALMAVMGLCLMIYNVGEYHLREMLKNFKETVPNQSKKEISKPTMKWIFQCFDSIVVTKFIDENGVVIKDFVNNLEEIHMRVIHFFGESAMSIYKTQRENGSDPPCFEGMLIS